MAEIEQLIALLGAVALLAWGARAVGLPYPIVLFAGGVGLGFLPGLDGVELDPDVVFLVFLPPLLHAAAYTAGVRRLRDQALPIGALSIGLVAFTIAAVAVVAHAVVDGLTWPAAFALGAIVGPTDPVAATAAFRRLGVPERIVGVVEGEALVNDATALVAYRIAVGAAVSGAFSALDGAGELASTAIGGAAIGLGVAYAIGWVRRRLDDSLIEIAVTLLTPYVAYIAAEELHVSGVLAAVVSGVVLGAQAHRLFSTSGARLQANAFWAVLVFLLESLLFILVGLQLPDVLDALPRSAGELALEAALVCAVVVGARLAFAMVAPGLQRSDRLVVGWSGMRGAVSLAAALSLPLTTDAGAAFPGRDEIIFLTTCVIAVTLVLQGLTLPALVRRTVPADDTAPGPRAQALARFQSVDAALERIGDLGADGDVPAPLVERARELYTSRASQLAGECRLGVAEEDTDTAAWLRLRLELLRVERAALVEKRDAGQVANAVVLSVERDLDLEEERIQARMPT